MDSELAVFDDVVRLADGLERLGLQPVLVGGMALVLLGSQRVTQDFDFVIRHPGELVDNVVDVFYSRGLELVSKLNTAREVIATIDNRKVAAVRLKLDAPSSAFFFSSTTLLRIDLLFDFPITAAELGANAVETRIGGRVLNVASAADLLRLKKIAVKKRSAPGDAQDIEFLKVHLKGWRGFVPEAADFAAVWSPLETVIDECLESRMNSEAKQIRVRSSKKIENSDKRTVWVLERTGRGASTETADVWLRYSGRAIEIHVWTIQP